MSIHPTLTNDEVFFITDAIKEIVENISEWKNDYVYSSAQNEYFHKVLSLREEDIKDLFLLHQKTKTNLVEEEKQIV